MPIVKLYRKDFFKKWTSDMAYIVGFICADGNIVRTKRGTHFVSLYSADKDLLESIRSALGSEHNVSARTSETGVVYRIQIGSKEWFSDLELIGIRPNKSKRLALPRLPKAFISDFVRGYFDGDGNVWSGHMNKQRATPTRALLVSFTSASTSFLRQLHAILRRKGVKGGSLYEHPSRSFGRLALSTSDALKLYEIMYTVPHKLFLTRKKVVFERFINERTQS